MKMKHLWMVPAITFAANTSAFSQDAAVADVPAAAKVNKSAEDFEAAKADVMLKDLADMMTKAAKEEGQDIDANAMLKILGLAAIDSYAYSSDKQGEEYLNLIYVHDNGANEGIFKLLGGQSAKYTVPSMTPAGTDLAMQMQLNLATLEQMIKGLMTAGSASDEDMAEFEESMKEEVPEMNMNVSALLKKININVNFALDLDPEEQLNLPFPGIGAIDKPRLVARVDNASFAWPALDKMLKNPDIALVRTEKDGIIVFKPAPEMQAMMMGYAPLFVMDTKKDQLWFATSQDFLGLCKSGENTLADDENFQATMKGFPKKGNAIFYMSKDLAKFVIEMVENQIEAGNLEKNEEINKMLTQLKAVETGLVQTYTRDETGAHVGSRSSESVKDSVSEMKKLIDEAMDELQ